MPAVERNYAKVQVFTVEDYFAGKRPDFPDTSNTLKKAARVKREREKDQELPLRRARSASRRSQKFRGPTAN